MAAYLKVTFWLALFSFSVEFPIRAYAGVRIGNESAITVPTSAHYSSAVNVRPGNGETVMFNPPTFSWFYNTNYEVGGEKNLNGFHDTIFEWTNVQQFLVYSNAPMDTTPVVDVTIPYNFYGMLPVLDTNATRQFWWKVVQKRSGSAYWTNGPYTFTITNGATNLNRSMLADSGYLSTNLTHPIFCMRPGEQASIYAWMQTQNRFWLNITNSATQATNGGYFKGGTNWPVNIQPNPTFANPNPADAFTRCNDLGALLLLWKVSDDPRWTNASMTGWLFTNLSAVVNWHNHPSNNWAMVDYSQPAGAITLLHLVIATYDWGFDYLGSDTGTFMGQLRTNALHGINRVLLWHHHTHFYWDNPYAAGTVGLPRYDWAYPSTTESAPGFGLTKLGISHQALNMHMISPAFTVASDTVEGRFAYDWFMNYMLARSSAYAGFAAHHVGPYGYTDVHIMYTGAGMLQSFMHLDRAYPQAQLGQTDFMRRFPEWHTRMHPYRMRKYHGAFGDGSPTTEDGHSGFLGAPTRGFDLMAVSRSGLARQAYDINTNLFDDSSGSLAEWVALPLRWHYTNTPAPLTNTTSAVYPEDGYMIASQISPSETNAYSHGVGFTLQARPRGSTRGHDIFSDLSFDLWAYGTQITDGGGMGLDPYCYEPEASPGLFINGYGEGNFGPGVNPYLRSPLLPVLASIDAFTNSGTNFVYAMANGTGMFTNRMHPISNIVSKVKRHVLFVRSKYWCIYDEFGTSSNSIFGFRWHIPWAFRYDAIGSPLSNETEWSNLMGSNSLAMTTNGFTYQAGNYASVSYPNPPRVPVHVMIANATNTWGVFRASGVANLAGANAASVVGTANTNSTLNPFRGGGMTWTTVDPDRAVGMWVTNTVAATNWNFLTVIVPQQNGVAAPTILRLDDNTVAVTYDGVTETNTFGTNYVGAYTYRVETIGDSGGGGSEPGGIRRARAGRVQAVRVIN